MPQKFVLRDTTHLEQVERNQTQSKTVTILSVRYDKKQSNTMPDMPSQSCNLVIKCTGQAQSFNQKV